MSNARVAILYKTLPQWRRDFFDRLRLTLRDRSIDLDLLYGQVAGADAEKLDTVDLPWAQQVHNTYIKVGSRTLLWQPGWRAARDSDLVVVEQASRLLINYPLLAAQRFGGTRIAFWGHGANLQTHQAHKLAEAVKRHVSRLPYWWFAYTEAVRERVEALGFPRQRITVVQNAIDTRALAEQVRAVTSDEIATFRSDHDLGSGPIGVFIGGLYPEKRLEFLLEASNQIIARRPDFRLLIIGAGVERNRVEVLARQLSHVRYLGPLFDEQKVLALAAADLTLLPGLVGLAVLDAFAAEAPLVTTAVPYHSPEIEYLRDGVNGMISTDSQSVDAYAGHALAALSEPLLSTLRAGCRAAAEKYTLEAMVDRFADGITSALTGVVRA